MFLLANMMPGDAVMAMISSDTPMEADLIKLRQGQLGLDLPLHVQYVRWLGNLAARQPGFLLPDRRAGGAHDRRRASRPRWS